MNKYKRHLASLLVVVLITATICSPAHAYYSQYDQQYSSGNQGAIDAATASYDYYHNNYPPNDPVRVAGETAAHQAAESARNGYSGGVDGSQYIPYPSGGSSGGGYYYAPTTYTITASSGTGGSISPSGSASVSEGGSQTYTITASSGYKISNVIVDGTSIGAASTYTFSNVAASHSISVAFASAATLSAGSVTLADGGTGTFTNGTTKSGYGVTVSLSVTSSYVSNTIVTASYNFTSAKTVSLVYVNGTWHFPVNSSSATGARKIYIPVDTPDGTYTITFTVKALDPQATALTGSNVYLASTKSVTFTVKGSMYEDDTTGDS